MIMWFDVTEANLRGTRYEHIIWLFIKYKWNELVNMWDYEFYMKMWCDAMMWYHYVMLRLSNIKMMQFKDIILCGYWKSNTKKKIYDLIMMLIGNMWC